MSRLNLAYPVHQSQLEKLYDFNFYYLWFICRDDYWQDRICLGQLLSSGFAMTTLVSVWHLAGTGERSRRGDGRLQLHNAAEQAGTTPRSGATISTTKAINMINYWEVMWIR